jgi:hypothetical protein
VIVHRKPAHDPGVVGDSPGSAVPITVFVAR